MYVLQRGDKLCKRNYNGVTFDGHQTEERDCHWRSVGAHHRLMGWLRRRNYKTEFAL